MTRSLVETDTKPVAVTLYDGAGADRTVIDGTGLTIGIVIHDRAGGSVDVTGKASWVDATLGQAQFEPAIGDFRTERSPYAVRFTVTDGLGDVASYPSGEPDVWIVRR